MFWRLKSKVILLIILETIDFIVKSIFIVGVCKTRGYIRYKKYFSKPISYFH